MQRKKSGSAARFWRWQLCVGAIVAFLALPDRVARADEGGVSFWLPGQFGSLAAVPVTPGWSLGEVYYHTTVRASGAVAAAREIEIGRFPATVNVNLNATLNAQADLLLLAPTYTFATPVIGGQSRFSWASSVMRISRSLPIPVNTRFWDLSSPGLSGSVPKWATSFRLEKCRDI
jgi:hypothetical protein